MNKNRFWFIIGALFLISACTYLFTSGQYINVVHALKSMNKWWLLSAMGLILIYWLVETKIIHLLINRLYKKKKFRDALKVSMIGQFFSGITPFATGGQPAQLVLLSKLDVPVGMGSSMLMSKFIIYQGILVLYAGILLILKANMFLSNISNLFSLVLIGFGVNLVVISALVFISISKKTNKKVSNKIIKILYKINLIKNIDMVQLKIAKNIEEFHQQVAILSGHKILVFKMVLLTFFQLTCYFLVPYCLYRGFGLTGVAITDIIAATAFVLMVTSFIPMPGGSGGAEGGFYIIFGMFFIGKYIVPAILVWRVITYYMWMVIGGFWVLSSNVNYARS
ncbi:MAG: flippase-like domain-containing protein [Clostridiales bacterium]|nr:flippase-like domain-containing protein [Clostridiales bacterium]